MNVFVMVWFSRILVSLIHVARNFSPHQESMLASQSEKAFPPNFARDVCTSEIEEVVPWMHLPQQCDPAEFGMLYKMNPVSDLVSYLLVQNIQGCATSERWNMLRRNGMLITVSSTEALA